MFESERWRHLVAVTDYQRRLLVTGPTNLLQFTSPARVWKDISGEVLVSAQVVQEMVMVALRWSPRSCLLFSSVVAYQKNLLQSVHCLEQAFISTGFLKWKDATAKFSKHEVSQCHVDSMLKHIMLPSTTCDVGELLSSQLARSDWSEARVCCNYSVMLVSLHSKAFPFTVMVRSTVILISCG